MKKINAFTLDEELKDFFEEKRKKGYSKSALANNILKESKEYKEYIRKKFGF